MYWEVTDDCGGEYCCCGGHGETVVTVEVVAA